MAKINGRGFYPTPTDASINKSQKRTTKKLFKFLKKSYRS